MNGKGVSVILSYAILFAVVITAAALAFRWGQTEVNELQDMKNLNSAETIFLTIDSMIKEVTRGGEDSSRVLRVNFDEGEFFPSSYHVSVSSTATLLNRDLKTISFSLEVKTDDLDANKTREDNIVKSYFNNIFTVSESYFDVVAETQNDDVYTVITLIDMKNIVLTGAKELYIKNEGLEEFSHDADPPYTLIIDDEEYTVRVVDEFLVVERDGSRIYSSFLGGGSKTYHVNIRVTTLLVKVS